MANAYKVVGRRAVQTLEPGEEGELELTAEEEQGHIAAGRLKIIPRAYRVCGPKRLSGPGYEAGPNDVFEAALSIGNEQTLTEAGHIERYGKKSAKKVDVKEKAESSGA